MPIMPLSIAAYALLAIIFVACLALSILHRPQEKDIKRKPPDRTKL